MTGEHDSSARLPDQVAECLRGLKAVDFELAYLAMLTREGLKPLSRWEKPPTRHERELLTRMGLITREIHRTVQTGRSVIETVFAVSPGGVEVYERQFAGRPIDKSPGTTRLEGFLFGYPPCCVEQYVRQPYAPNGRPDETRTILFHWPCRECRITPLLLPAYRAVYTTLEQMR